MVQSKLISQYSWARWAQTRSTIFMADVNNGEAHVARVKANALLFLLRRPLYFGGSVKKSAYVQRTSAAFSKAPS